MAFIRKALERPYTVVAMMILVCIGGVLSAWYMPIDIFPEINIPVVSVVWTYSGMSPKEMQDRILSLHERQLASLVDDVARTEATSYEGVGVIKVYLQEGADVSRAVSQLGSSALVVLKYMPRNITPPLILRYGATDVPIIQLSISSPRLSDTALNNLGQNVIRPDLAVVKGSSVPYPFGGKPRVVMVDLNEEALHARGLSPSDVSDAIQRQNVILPSGDVKLGNNDYPVTMNNSPDAIKTINDFPIRQIEGRTIFVHDIAHVHEGYQIQTNSVNVNGLPGSLMMVRKTGGVSTLDVISSVKGLLDKLRASVKDSAQTDVSIQPIFDQSIFVKASLNSVLMGGTMAAALTALMILLFLGNWRLTIIILASIPLSIITGVLGLKLFGQTLNTMTLGGFALAVGILVDNATVVIENVDRRLATGMALEEGIIAGAAEVALPTFVSTVAICIVFVPVFLLQGTAKYLFSPLSMSVILSLLASLLLSFTLVPVMFKYIMRSFMERHVHRKWQDKVKGHSPQAPHQHGWWTNPLAAVHMGFEHSFNAFRNAYRNILSWCVARPGAAVTFFVILIAASLLLFGSLGRDFFPQVDAGQMRLHVRAPPGTRLEKTQEYFAQVESEIRRIVGSNQIDIVLDNIGLPYSGINIALSDTATVGPMDGEILISLNEKHTSTATHMADLRRELPKKFPELRFFFQPADIVNQVLNFGQPAPIDVRITARSAETSSAACYALATRLTRELNHQPGIVDAHVFQIPNAPELKIDVNRTFAQQMNLSQQSTANSLLVSLNSSAQTAPNFWLDDRSGISYPLVVQTPTYKIKSMADLETLPLTIDNSTKGQLLMNIATFRRGLVPMVMSQHDIHPVFDVNADVQGVDLQTAANEINKVIDANRPDPKTTGIEVELSGQIKIMQDSFSGLFGGMGLAVALVYLLMVMIFQSWLDPLIVLMAVPFALAGVIWMLFLTQTHLSVPALMGSLMCIGLTTANSILVVTFANDRIAAGSDVKSAAVAAGYIRLRPVLMTAGAMILGMIPMALGVGEGGEQNAPLARAVIGGLLLATVATLIFVPTMYGLLRRDKASQVV